MSEQIIDWDCLNNHWLMTEKVKSVGFEDGPVLVVGGSEFEDAAFMADDIAAIEHMFHIEGQIRKRTKELNLNINLIQTIVLMRRQLKLKHIPQLQYRRLFPIFYSISLWTLPDYHTYILNVTKIIVLRIDSVNLQHPAIVLFVDSNLQVPFHLVLHDGNAQFLHQFAHYLIAKPIYF